MCFFESRIFSGLAGFWGMLTATTTSSRAAYVASRSLDSGLCVVFRSGAVIGLSVVTLALVDYSIWFIVLNTCFDDIGNTNELLYASNSMLTFSKYFLISLFQVSVVEYSQNLLMLVLT